MIATALSSDLQNSVLIDTSAQDNMNTSHEVGVLKDAIKEFGTVNANGNYSISYGLLFEKTANTLEALNGTLRAAKRQKKVAFEAELLMMPKDKEVPVVLLEK